MVRARHVDTNSAETRAHSALSGDADSRLATCEWLDRFVAVFELVAGAPDPGSGLSAISDMVATMPMLPPAGRALVLSLVIQLCVRLRRSVGEISIEIIAWGCTHWPNGRFRDELMQILGRCEGEHRLRTPSLRQVRDALAIIRSEHADHELSLSVVASRLRTSVSHLSRLITSDTRHCFSWHLRRVRVTAAAQLIHKGGLSMKEVAYRVGYNSTLQLDRNVRKCYGTTPTVLGRSERIGSPLPDSALPRDHRTSVRDVR
jgi:AraC-like DNA-binding protein